MVTGVMPAGWFDADQVDTVITHLAALPIDPEDRKRAFHAWCAEMGVTMTAEMVERVTGLPASEV